MRRPVLIVTASIELGELISKSLADTFQFDVFRHGDQASAIAFLDARRDCGHALLEVSLGEARVIELGRALRSIRHNIKLILISRGQPSARLDQIRPWSLLRQPFLLPDLLAALDTVAPTIIDVEAAERPGSSPVSWLDDPALAVETLERLSAASNIEEVILLRKYDLWACAGRLGPDTVSEIQHLVLRNIDSEQDFDLLRYMRLTSHEDQHGLWAKLLLANVILAVIYDLNTSFAEMRRQTNALADALSRPVLSQPLDSESRDLPPYNPSLRLPPSPIGLQAPAKSQDWRQSNLPDPLPIRRNLPPPESGGPHLHPNIRNAGRRDPDQDLAASGDVPDAGRKGLESLDTYLRSRSPSFRDSGRPAPRSGTRPERPAPDESATLDAPRIPYSCLLTPRFESTRLTADLAGILHGTLPQVCISYGWWLEFLEVMADCLHWVAVLPPTETVADHVQTVRALTSGVLLDAFPEYFRENFSKDFWAPGYSVRAGAQRHSRQEMNSYVLNYRVPWRRYASKPPLDSGPSSQTQPD